MSFRDWLHHPPIGVGLVVLALLVIAGLHNHYREAASADHATDQKYEQAQAPPQGQAAKSKTDRAEERADRDLDAQEGMARWAFWLLIATVTGVFLLAATLHETWKAGQSAAEILKETRRQADIAEDTAKRQLRAYVSPEHAALVDFVPAPDNTFSVRITFKNTGQTPAYDFRGTGSIDISAFPLKSELSIPASQPVSGRTIIGPGGEHDLNIGANAIPKDYWGALTAGAAAIYIHGWYSYRDAFKITRKGHFLFYSGGKDGLRVDGTLTVYTEGNETD